MIALVCPICKKDLQLVDKRYLCPEQHFFFDLNDGVLTSSNLDAEEQKDFYDDIYNSEKGRQWSQGLNRSAWAKRVLEKISLSYRRERFFKNNIKGRNNLILDLACGDGRDYFKNFGEVIGIDLSFKPLIEAKKKYDLVIQSGVSVLPFADNSFDYIVSSDFFGHVAAADKDVIIKEIYRILKPGGKSLHVIETDSRNVWFRIAHKNGELFQKYFVEKIGGHIGLELPSQCVKRWRDNGFVVDRAIKIWGIIWPISDYWRMFGNEYLQESSLVRIVAIISKVLSSFKPLAVMINVLLNPLNSLVEAVMPIDNGQGLMIIVKK